MDTRSARRGRSSPVVGDSVESASPIAIEAIKPESSATTSPLASSTAANLNGTAAAGASEPMETTETDEAETVTKKRKTGTGSRGVANLTPEQLAKKRANDREAQRAIRERTRNQIERLEKRIRELESQKPYQDLQVVVRAKEAIEAENAEIKRRLATIITMLQPIVGTSDPGVPSTLPSAAAPTAVPVTSSVPYHPAAPAGGVADPQRQPTQPPLQSWSSAGSSSSPPPHRAGLAGAVDEATRLMLEQQGHSLRHGLDFGSGRFDFNVVLDPIQAIPKLQRGRDGAQDTGEFHHVAMKHDWTQVSQDNARPTSTWDSPLAIPSPGSDPASGVLPKAATSQPASSSGLGLDGAAPNIPPVSFPDAQAANIVESLPLWARPLRNCEPTCPLDALLLDFRSERQQRAAEGYEPNEVTGPRYPSVSSLLNPANSKYSHPVSKVFTDIVGKFPEISRLPEKVTILYLMFIYMRWQISPTKENHERLPEWIRPLPCQLDIPHPAWMDYLPYPEMRERVILANDPSIFYFDNWFLPFTSTFTISWPYEEAHTLLRNPDSDEIMINPVFESHMRNLDNWKVGRAFAEAFPMLVDTCKFWDGTNQQQSPT